MIKKIRCLKDGFENFKRNQTILIISAIYSFIFASLLYSFNEILPRLLSIYSARIFIFIMLLFILLCCAYFFERFLIALMIRILSEKRKNFEKSFKYVESIVGNFILASFLYLCLGGFTLLASQLLAPIELLIFLIVVIIVSIKLVLYEYTIVIDNVGIKESFITSWKMTEGNWFNIFLLKSFFFTIYISISFISYIISNFTTYQINIYLVIFLSTFFFRPWEISTFLSVFKNLKRSNKNI